MFGRVLRCTRARVLVAVPRRWFGSKQPVSVSRDEVLSTYRTLLETLEKRCTVSYTDLENDTLSDLGTAMMRRSELPPMQYVREKYKGVVEEEGGAAALDGAALVELHAWGSQYVSLLASTMAYEVELKASGWGVPDRQPIPKFAQLDPDDDTFPIPKAQQ